jgi:hypothetical protein
LLFLDKIKNKRIGYKKQNISYSFSILVFFIFKKYLKNSYGTFVEEAVDVVDFDGTFVEEAVDVVDFDWVFISGDSAAIGLSSFVFLSKSPPGNAVAPVGAPTGKGFLEVSLPSILFPKDDRP